ncbi:uncharacterized protein LOC8065713 [Sorghum bicolor]|uniref:uncharacterized protein LOC8065713 n=1 Tax=Sorghum bicolor TaxID=4558 RepID=UPI000B424FFF|nr:uncharacterized protein LOC8065713 [Sorghum bicolor]|eukprot:XP_002438148.2 uncharacterized protein LOC8065713 [Sorghum bicolor]
MVPDSVDMVPDSVESLCSRCGTLHVVGGVLGRDSCYEARRNARRCGRCGLLHEEYDIPVKFLHLMDKFDCEFYIPDVDKLVMRGSSIYVTDEVLEKVEAHIRKVQAKTNNDEEKTSTDEEKNSKEE